MQGRPYLNDWSGWLSDRDILQVNQLLQDRTMLMEENQKLWHELEETKAALAFEVALRSAFCRVGSASSLISAPLQLQPR